MSVPLPRLAVIATAVMASLLAAVSPALASPAAPATGDVQAGTTTGWPQLQGNAAHTGFEPGETSVTSSNVNQLGVAWTAPLPSPVGTPDLTVAGGTLYAASGTTVTALNAVTGAQLWQTSLPGTIASTPAVQGSLVITGYDEGRGSFSRVFIVALSSATGAVVWTHRVSGPQLLKASVTTTPRQVYVSLTSGQVLALGIAHGFQLWASPALPGATCDISAPSVSGGLVVVGGGGGYVSALHASDGTLAWQDNLGGGCGSSGDNWVPAISGTTVYAGLLSGVAALDLASGAIQWTSPSAGMVFSPLSVTGGTVIAGANNDTEPVALARSDGTVQWTSPFHPPVTFVGGMATFGSLTWATIEPAGSDAQAVAFNTATGHKVFSSAVYSDPSVEFPPPVVAAGRVYLDLTNKVLCLTLPAT
jgi:outer membrane protein assembly factor BamB